MAACRFSATISRPLLLPSSTLNLDRFLAASCRPGFSALPKCGLLQVQGVHIQRGGRRLLVRSFSADAKPGQSDAPRSVPVGVAHELLKSGHRYLDVRTPEEFTGGHPVGAINIPYMYKSGLGMAKNHNFLEEVSSTFKKDDNIIIGCQSGKRSLMAATDLQSAGFSGITDVTGGFFAWSKDGLPTE